MKVKKWVLGFITFAAMAVICAVCAGAETYGNFEYDVLDDGTVEITDYNGSAEKVDIPEKIDGRSVTEIGNYAFYNCKSLTSVTIPNSVASIGGWAFIYCESLTSITIPDSVTSIGGNAFERCKNLTSITIPDGVTSIGSDAFSNTALLENQTTTIKYVDKWVVECDNAVSSVTIKNGTVGIADSVFEDCANLTNITVPNGVTSIGGSAFRGCTSLTSITIPNSVTRIGDNAFSGCSSLTSVTIPNSVTEIGTYAFGWCRNLTSVTIPSNVTSIGDSVFRSCTSLIAINVVAENQNYVSVNGVLYNKGKTAIICYPAGKKDKSYKMPDSVTSISKSAFSGCTSLTSITIPNSVTYISDDVFSGCTSLASITIPDSVTSIEYDAFRDCTSLTSVTIPDSVTSIGDYAFCGCRSLKSITIPDSVTSIGDYAFSDCRSLKSITIPDSVTSIGDYAFSDCRSLTNITIPDSVTRIGYAAFGGCSILTSITIPNSLTYISQYAFSGCASLTSITIPNSVTSIGTDAFNGCTSLISITIPDSVTRIGGYAFEGCLSLTNITIPDSVTRIEYRTFFGCTSLTSVTIPNSVTSIGDEALGYYYNDKESKKLDGFKIYCYSGTEGEKYAKDNGFAYELLDKPILSKVTGVKLGGRAADALRVNWSKNASADGYIVEMYQNGKWVRVAKITNNSTTTFRKAGLKAGTVYKFRVKAYKMYDRTALYSVYSDTVAARTNPSAIKGAKLGGRAADALRINWSKNASADGYIVEMYQGNKWVRAGKITNNSTTTFRKAGLKASSVYKFRVRAYKMSGSTALYGNYSATVTARTNPSIMKGVKIAGKAKDALRVNWAKNASAQGYIVEMYKGGKWVRVAKITNGNTTTFRKAGLAKNTTYKFRVKAYYMSGKTALYGNYGSVSGKTAAK